MAKRDDHSIKGEPFYFAVPASAPEDSVANEPGFRSEGPPRNDDERALHNVWDEPAFQATGAAPPDAALNYSRWFEARRLASTPAQSWSVVLLLALCGGPFAAVGTIITGLTQGSTAGPLVLAVVAPVLEEMMKIGALLIVLENRPYLFRSGAQLVIAAMASGYLFSVVENLLYIYVYHPEGTEAFRLWRWTVCSALHTGTSTVAGIGLRRMWRRAILPAQTETGLDYQRPEAVHAYPYIVAAVLIHGVYNGTALLLEVVQGPI